MNDWTGTGNPPIALPVEQGRALEDILTGERRLRTSAEVAARALHQVLLDLAIRFDGVRLEELRRGDPAIPGSWSAVNWQRFFADVRVQTSSSWLDVEAIQREREALQMQIDNLKAQLAAAKTTVQPAAQLPEAPMQQISAPLTSTGPVSVPVINLDNVPEGFTPTETGLLTDATVVFPTLPQTCPSEFRKTVGGGGRDRSDLLKAYQRTWLALRMIGHWRLNSKIEILTVMGRLLNMSAGTGSLRRVLEDLAKANLLIEAKPELKSPSTSLILYRFTPDGALLYKAVYGEDPEESDWERLIRLHEGERFPEHTLAVQIFAMHARKRGWTTRVLPPVDGTNAIPDLAICQNGQTLFVEVELSKKESPAKWKNQAALNNGKVVICAATPEGRKRLVGDCRLAHLPGMATDLETLVKVKLQDIGTNTPLWLEDWQ